MTGAADAGSPATTRTARDNALGIAAMLGTTVAVPLMGMCVKLLADAGLGAVPTMALRSVGVLLLVLPLLLLRRNRRAIVEADKRAHLWHALFGLSSMACFYYGLAFLPLVVVTSINFTTPIFVMLLAIPVLKERPGGLAFLAAGLGFAGSVLALDPTGADVKPQALVVLLGAFLTGCMIMAVRRMPARSTHFAVLFYYAAIGTAVFGGLGLLFATPQEWATLRHGETWALIALISGLAGLLQFLIVIAYRLAASAGVSGLDYLRLVWAAGIGWLVFSEWPSPVAMAGMALIVASGVWLVMIQRRRG